MAAPITNNPYDADTHLLFFSEFCTGVQRAGGATPHMLTAVQSAQGMEMWQQLWRIGCYAFVYNIPTAEVLWRYWQPGEWKHAELVEWIRVNWAGLKFRKERKAARSPERLATCMKSYVDFMHVLPTREWFTATDMDPITQYTLAFQDICDNVMYMGRYIAIRWLECVRHLYHPNMTMYDISPKDGDHPRKALALMYPEYHDELMGGNDNDTIEVVNAVAEYCMGDLQHLYQTRIDYYTMQSLLCEYKQSVLAMKQYPGKSVDTELAYWHKVYPYWGQEFADGSEFWQWRKAIFPSLVLGELQGWNGVRDVLGTVLRTHGYTWFDDVYDYTATLESNDFSNPVMRHNEIS